MIRLGLCCIFRDEPIKFRSSRQALPGSEPAAGGAMAQLLEQNQADVRELKQAVDALARRLGQEGK